MHQVPAGVRATVEPRKIAPVPSAPSKGASELPEVFPKAPLPAGTNYRTWVRAAGIGRMTISELLAENTRVQASFYEAAVQSLKRDREQEAAREDSTGHTRWNTHAMAEETLTTALKRLQDNEVQEALSLLLQVTQQVNDVVRMDTNERYEEN